MDSFILLDVFLITLPHYIEALLSLAVELLIIQVACQALATANECFAVRIGWTRCVAGIGSEILSILPECIVIAYLVPVSPLTVFIVVAKDKIILRPHELK